MRTGHLQIKIVTTSFPIWVPSPFSWLVILTRTSTTMNRSGENGHSCRGFALKRKAFSLSTLSMNKPWDFHRWPCLVCWIFNYDWVSGFVKCFSHGFCFSFCYYYVLYFLGYGAWSFLYFAGYSLLVFCWGLSCLYS